VEVVWFGSQSPIPMASSFCIWSSTDDPVIDGSPGGGRKLTQCIKGIVTWLDRDYILDLWSRLRCNQPFFATSSWMK